MGPLTEPVFSVFIISGKIHKHAGKKKNSDPREFYQNMLTSDFLKGQSNEIFELQFVSSFKPAWASDQWVKLFLILVKIFQRYLHFVFVCVFLSHLQ